MKCKIFLALPAIYFTMLTSAFAMEWNDLVTDAYMNAEAIVTGTVMSVDDQTAVDGGHVYGLQLTSWQKGDPGNQFLVRAGGFFYTVDLNVGESVMVFLRTTSSGTASSGDIIYSLVEVEGLRPMAFHVAGSEVIPADARLSAAFAGVTIQDFENMLSNLGR